MAQSIDALSIQITASCQEAIKSIGTLTRRINSLSTAISKIDTKNLTGLATALDSVGANMSNIKSNNISSTLKGMSNATSNLSNSASGINKTAQAMSNFNTQAKSVGSNIRNFNSFKATSNLGNSIANASDEFKNLNKPLTDSIKNAKTFKGTLLNFKIVVPTGRFEKVNKEIENVKYSYERLRNIMSQKVASGGYVDDSAYEKDQKKLDGLRQAYNDLLLEQERLAREGGNVKFNTSGVEKFKSSFKEIKSAINSALGTMKRFGSFVSGVFNSALTPVKNFVKSLGSIKGKGKSASSGMKMIDLSATKFLKPLTRISKMLRLMIVRKILQAFIKNAITGFNNATVYSDKFNASVSLLWNSMRQTGNAVGGMVAPLINALAPALNMIIQQIIQVINWMNQLFSTLTGATTWLKAKTLSDSYADSLDKTGKSANKLKKQLQGFDALNNLTSQDDNSGTSPKDMFEEMEIDQNMKNIGDWLKQMWELGDFYDLGKALGEKFRDWLNSIPWAKIRKTSKKLGEVLASLINGFIEVEGLGYSIGRTFAQALNTVFEFVNGFVHKLNWDALGKFIAKTFNGFFENIDWKLIKDTVITGIKGLSTAINSFIDTFHWNNVSNTIANLVNILSESIYTFFTNTDFGKLGTKLGEQLRKTIEKIDWKELGKALGSVIKNGVEFCVNFINEQDFDTIKQAFANFFNGLSEEIDIDQSMSKVIELFNKLTAYISDFFDNLDTIELGKKLAERLNKIVDEIDWVSLGNAIGSVVQKAIDFLSSFIKNTDWVKVKTAIVDLIKGFFEKVDPMELAEIIAGVIASAFIYAKTMQKLTSACEVLGGVLGDAFVVAFAGYVGFHLGKALGKAISGDADLYDNFKWTGEGGFFDTLFGDIGKADTIKDKLKELKESIFDIDSGWKELLKEGTWLSVFSSIIDGAVRTEFPMANMVANVIGYAKTINDNIDLIKRYFTTSWNEFNKWWEQGGIKKWFNDTVKPIFKKENWTFEGIKDGLKGAFEGAIKGIKSVWNSFVEWINKKLVIRFDTSTLIGKAIAEVIGKSEIKLGQLPTFATGGFPENGLFMANSTEMVGKFTNGKNAVANNQQIVDGIARGVAEAQNEQNKLLRQQNSLLQSILEKDTGITADNLFRSVQNSANNYYRRTGRYAFD